MMGERHSGQSALFYEFDLERHVPVDHLLRSIDQVGELESIRTYLKPYFSEMGRPSICPELMIPDSRHYGNFRVGPTAAVELNAGAPRS